MISGSQYKPTPAPTQTQSANKTQSAPSSLNIDDMISKSPHNAGNQQQSLQPQSQQPSKPDMVQQALNYHTGNNWIDAPMGVLQGVGKGIMSTGIGAGQLLSKIPGMGPITLGDHEMTPEDEKQLTSPSGIGQGTGKLLEQVGEFALPAGEVAKGLKGAGLGVRALGQAGVGAGVGALQSKGDVGSTVASGLLGGVGELAGPALSGVKKLIGNKAPNLANFADSFGGATPTQKAKITGALKMLTDDGIKPENSIQEMSDSIKGKIADIHSQYQTLDPVTKSRSISPTSVTDRLELLKGDYQRRGVVTDEGSFNSIQGQIDKVNAIAKNNNGNLNLDDILHMKLKANGNTNWNSTGQEQDLWKGIGNSFRGASDDIAPEITPLNKDLQKYHELDNILDQNIARGKGNTASGLDILKGRMQSGLEGAYLGSQMGHAVAGVPGGILGTLLGGAIGPGIGKAASQALQNAADSGALAKLSPIKKIAMKAANKIGDNAAIIKLLGVATTQEASSEKRSGGILDGVRQREADNKII